MALLTRRIKDLLTVENNTRHSNFGEGNRNAVIIAICSQKGGVGKTTTAINLGTSLAKFFNKKTLVVDLDPQGHVEKSLGALVPEGVEYAPMSTILSQKRGNILDAIIPTELENFHLTPGDKTLYETESLLVTKIGKEFVLGDSLKAARKHFDFILFDCPPNLGNLTLNALVCSDYCIVPCEMSVLAFEGVNDLIETIDVVNERLNKRLKVLGVLFTRVDKRNLKMNKIIEQNIRSLFHNKILKSQIAVNTDINKAQLEGRPLFELFPKSSGTTNYRELAQEVLQKLKRFRSQPVEDEEEGQKLAV